MLCSGHVWHWWLPTQSGGSLGVCKDRSQVRCSRLAFRVLVSPGVKVPVGQAGNDSFRLQHKTSYFESHISSVVFSPLIPSLIKEKPLYLVSLEKHPIKEWELPVSLSSWYWLKELLWGESTHKNILYWVILLMMVRWHFKNGQFLENDISKVSHTSRLKH